ncbi:hypothetical protein PMAYCL1PPCAC_02183 [Pristionchus mayeri]|uniref:C2H2-type domain-containing protein n=1 Tax=Pristionchus mayeri TaxID=1317129 RepID=A0AAN4Z0X3_9BILA|nr:hypothetical protein PMAYCL1PPCAC_02183 [Pristionchus mayeri]
MVSSFFFRDGKEVKGPFGENEVLDKYRMAEFSSDVQFQIRLSESEEEGVAPFISLSDLIRENGHKNPFRKDEHLEKIIEEKEKEVERLTEILAKKSVLEKRIEDIEKRMEELRKRRETSESKSNGSKESRIEDARKKKQMEIESSKAFPLCSDCDLVVCSYRQLQSHLTRSSCRSPHPYPIEFHGDQERWKKEDEQRLAAGQRIYKRMSPEGVGSARPQIEFVDELHLRIKKKMKLEGNLEGTRAWIKSKEAVKVKDRFLKHLREAEGNLVCTRCKVASRSHCHFILHLCTYEHRLKVKGSPMEELSLLIGHFHKKEFLQVPDPSELDEDLEVNSDSSAPPPIPLGATPASTRIETCSEEELASQKQSLILDWANREAMYCLNCGIMFSSYKQWLLHMHTEEHEEKAQTKNGDGPFNHLFDQELQKWRWEDRIKLSAGKSLYESMSEEERKGAVPREEFIEEMGKELQERVNEVDDGSFYGYLPVARYLRGNEGKRMMDRLEEHLRQAKIRRFVCRPCKVAFDETEKYFVHCQMAKHLLLVHSTHHKFISTLIGQHKKDLYFK